MLKSKTALVTGSTSGIGKAIATRLAREGADIVLNGFGDAQEIEAYRQELESEYGVKAIFKGTDLTDAAAIEVMMSEIQSELGSVDILVNNAGITRDGTLHRMSHESWQKVIDTDLGSCFNMCRVTIDDMRAAKFGRVINIGSINGQAGQYGQVNYAAAKSGIHGFTKAMSQEGAAQGITVNAIAPGYVDTDMVAAVPEQVLEKIIAKIPVGRLGKASEIARGVCFLVADDAGFVTGSTLSINGGQHMY